MIFSKGKVDATKNISDDEALLKIPTIEKILLSLGKNELDLLKNISAAAPSEDWHYFEKPTSQLTYEMNSFGMKRQSFEKIMLNSNG